MVMKAYHKNKFLSLKFYLIAKTKPNHNNRESNVMKFFFLRVRKHLDTAESYNNIANMTFFYK